MDRRTTIKWVLAASASWPLANAPGARASAAARAAPAGRGYGTDPKLTANYRPGELWPLTFDPAARRLAGVLCDLIIPADGQSPGASSVGVVDFIDEWVSAPYPSQRKDRDEVLAGFAWLHAESARRSGREFADLDAPGQTGICDSICNEAGTPAELRTPARFFSLYRDLTAGGFYSTPVGRQDLKYIGNVPLTRFEGPPLQLLTALGLP